ncbi:BON domain-containing protein [Rhizobium sp. BK376]|uniref:BON domain-containing protein n=1 Tax=Rhizobium sp. BK376 TaxID=2512149 RepID=UPI00104DBDE7|nr:BON domain-containing protein [Rhizobium sp. BK376]TCR76653.1 osmotically-inducible protein OsmY [Rhizobium sp. BK376]
MDDIALRQNILDALEYEPSLDAADIGVTSDNGIVTLTGRVQTYAEKENAERIVKRIKGVRGIVQGIDVRIYGAKPTDDDDIARRAANMIDWNVSIPSGAVQVRVIKGWITLSGKVAWQFQKSAASDAMRHLDGVIGVSNLIDVMPRATTGDVKARIEKALERDAELEAQAIGVDVSGGKVTLRGKVRTWSERQAAERAAWSAKGVTALDDQLSIG